jgi:hypothetical protein
MPDPSALPLTIRGGDNRSRPTPAGELERLIGKKEWDLKTDSGQNVWDFFNLTAEVAAKPKVLRPVLCHGGRGGWDWKPIGEFFQALADARQPVMSRGEWGEVDPPALKNPGQGRYGLNVRGDRPIMVFARCSSDYQGGRNGDGGSTNMGVWWDESSVVDEPGKFEVVLTGHATVDLTPRRLKNFAVKPAEQVDFKTEGARQGDRSADRTGQVAADGNGLVTVPQVPVTNRTKVIITRSTP